MLAGKLLTLIQLIWVKEQLQQDFKDATIIHIYKWKGNGQTSDYQRRISLLSISGKILAKVLLNRHNKHFKHRLLHERKCSVNAASVRNVGLLTWCLMQDSCMISFKNRTVTSTRLMLIWPRHLTWSAETAFGESWQNTATPKNSSPSFDNFMTACMQGCKTTEKAP